MEAWQPIVKMNSATHPSPGSIPTTGEGGKRGIYRSVRAWKVTLGETFGKKREREEYPSN